MDAIATMHATFDLLAEDVSGDQDITEAHPRWEAHLTLMAAIADLGPEWEARMDAIRGDDIAGANRLARDGIEVLRSRLA